MAIATGTRSGGRKSTANKVATPLPMSSAPARGWRRCEWFGERFCKIPSGKGALSPFALRPWQRDDIVSKVFPEEGSRPYQALIELARGQGKSTLACLLALYAAFADDVEGPEVLLVANNERNAERLLRKLWRIISLNPELESRCELYKADRRIEIGFNGGAIHALPSRFDALQGYEPSFIILDEAHVVEQEVYDALVTSLAKQVEPTLLVISTPGDSQESLLWRLVQQGRASDEDPAFLYVTYAAPADCEADDVEAWKAANPALGDFLHIDGIAAAASSMLPHRENQFRRLHLCQWSGSEDHWIPWGVWDGLADHNRKVPPGSQICLGFDGSVNRDATALIGCTVPVDDKPHLFVLGFWEWDRPGWRVPLDEVYDRVAEAFAAYDVAAMAVDKSRWRNEIERWRIDFDAHDRIIDVSQSALKMVPATDRLYQAVLEGELSHDGHEGLSRHVHNAVAVSKPGGVMIQKPKNAPAKDSAVGRIDAAVASIMVFDEACHRAAEPVEPVVESGFIDLSEVLGS